MFNKLTSTARILTLSVLALTLPPQLFAAGPAIVFLRSTENFVILSGAAITSTGGGSITGDVGASPIAGSAIGVSCDQMTGAIYAVDATGPACAEVEVEWLTSAKGNLTLAYNDAAGRGPEPTGPFLNPNGGNLGGQTLVPELYKFTGTALITGADVTLTGGPDDVWIFQIAADLQVGSGIKVILAGGARAANVFWQVGTSAVLGTGSEFKGTILADQSITLNTGSTLEGRAFASTGGVTFNGTSIRLPGAIAPEDAPEFSVQQPPGVNLANGSSQDFGLVDFGANTSRTFTITNTGTTNLTGLAITIAGADAALFTVTANPSSSVGPNGSTTFTVRFAPLNPGVKTAMLHIAHAADANQFNLTLTGTGTGAEVFPSTNIVVTTESAITLNPQTGLFEQTVALTNDGATTIPAFRLLI